MFLNAIKLFFAKRLLRNDSISQDSIYRVSKNHTIGILFNAEEAVSIEQILNEFKAIFPNNYKIEALVYSKDKNLKSVEGCISSSLHDFNLFGGVKSENLKDFLNKELDLMVHYYKKPELPLQLIAQLSKAQHHVGFFSETSHHMILMVDTQINQPNVFFKTLYQYLILTKLI